MFLDTTKANTNIVVKSPGAIHNARWMAKALYTLKIALFRNQLKNVHSEKELENICSLAIFLAAFYKKQWLTSANTRDTPRNHLELLRKLTKTEDCIQKSPKGWPRLLPLLVKKAREKFENHLWYLSERLVFLSLFSDNVTISEKQLLRRAMIKYQGKFGNVKQKMTVSANLGQKSLKKKSGKRLLECLSTSSIGLQLCQFTSCCLENK